MKEKAVIIISNELEQPFPLFVFNCENNHSEGLKEFVYQVGISLPEIKNISTPEIAFYLGELGYVVMLYNKYLNENDLVIFLPKQISPKQLEWFEKRKKGLLTYNIMIFEHDADKKWRPIDQTTTKEPIISELDKITTKKLIKK